MQTKNFVIDRERIQKLYDSTPETNTGFYKVPKSELFGLYDMLSEMLEAYEELQKQNTILQNGISLK